MTTRPLTVDAPPTLSEAWAALSKLFGPNMLTATVVVLTKEPGTQSVRMTTYTFPDGAFDEPATT